MRAGLKLCHDDLRDAGLGLFGHLDVRGQAEAAGEDVFVDRAVLDIDEVAVFVEGLHMHRLPDGAALDVLGSEGVQDVHEACLYAAVDQHAAEPEVGHGVREVRVHRYGNSGTGQQLFVAVVDRFLGGAVLVKVDQLAAADARDDIGHAVVVAELLMLVPRGRLARLRGPEQGLVAVRLVAADQHAAAAGGYDLVAVEAECAPAAESAAGAPLVGRAEGLGRVLDQRRAVRVADRNDLVQPGRGAVKMRKHHGFRVRVLFKSPLESAGVHVPGLALAVDEDLHAALVGNGIDGGAEGHVAAEHDVAGLDAGELHGEVKGAGAGRQSYRVLLPAALCRKIGGRLSFKAVAVEAERRHPVAVERFFYKLHLLAVHSRRR